MKEYCEYIVMDKNTQEVLISGRKYRKKIGLSYLESFRCPLSRFKKVYTYTRTTVIKGCEVVIVYWFNAPKRNFPRDITFDGFILGVR